MKRALVRLAERIFKTGFVWLLLPCMIVAWAGEGAIEGWKQWCGLRHDLAELEPRT